MADQAGRRYKAYRRGHRSEWLAALALMLKGYRIVARRYRTKLGEIDLIARRGDLVIMVEVKARPTLLEAMEAIGRESERRIEGAADLWLARQKDYGAAVRALRHGGRAAAPLAGARRERVPRSQLNAQSAPRHPHRQTALRLRRQLLDRPRSGGRYAIETESR